MTRILEPVLQNSQLKRERAHFNTPVALVICIAFVTFVRWWQSVRGPELEPDGSRFTIER